MGILLSKWGLELAYGLVGRGWFGEGEKSKKRSYSSKDKYLDNG